MNRINNAAEHAFRRVAKMWPTLRDLEQHLIHEQADAIAGPRDPHAPRPQPTQDTPQGAESDANVDVGHGDPTPSAAARLAVSANKNRKILAALDALDKAIDHVELTASACVSTRPDPTLFDEPLCPGWTDELRAQLGGCGKRLEGYTRNDGTTGLRDLCASCRKAKGKHDRATEAEAA